MSTKYSNLVRMNDWHTKKEAKTEETGETYFFEVRGVKVRKPHNYMPKTLATAYNKH